MPNGSLGKVHFECVPVEPVSFFHLFHHPKTVPFYHYHPEIELAFFPKGHGTRFVGDSVQSFGPGDLCLLGPNLLHAWYIREPECTEAIVVQVRPEMLASAAALLPEFRRLLDLPTLCARGVLISGPQVATIARHLTRAAKAREGSIARFTAILLAMNAACEPAGHHTLSTTSPALSQADPHLSRFARVIDALHAQMPKPPNQASLARQIGLSPAGFSYFFKRFVGKSYVDYVNAWRINLACRQLLQTDLSITQIAFDCGFENLSNFNRRFRQYKKSTPRDYRASAATSHPSR